MSQATVHHEAVEFNFDGLIGPTHNYAGLARGNLASQENRRLMSHPRQAALQGLVKMCFLMRLGVPQGVLPPQERPDMAALRRHGFTGSDGEVLQRAAGENPDLLAACCSASAMWAANAATISPSPDTADGRVHITTANLASHLHRSLEAPATDALLRQIFRGPHFVHHGPLPAAMPDEGAANHSRFCLQQGAPGLELFAAGPENLTTRVPARQKRIASETIAQMHQLKSTQTFFAEQHPDALDAGAFHTDVVAVAHRNVFLFHELAFVDAPTLMENLGTAFKQQNGSAMLPVNISESLLPLADAVRSYFFNSQLVTLPNDRMAFIAPTECQTLPSARAAIDHLRERIPSLDAVHFVDVRQSMMNGGGPACLRLRVVLTPQEQAAVLQGVILTEPLYQTLRAWVQKHYRENLSPADLADPCLLTESRRASDELAVILGLPPLS